MKKSFTAAAWLVLLCVIIFSVACKTETYTQKQIDDANTYYSNWKSMKDFNAGDVKTESDKTVVLFSGTTWDAARHDGKVFFLTNMSFTCKVLGKPQHVVVKDYTSGKLYAEVNPPMPYKIYTEK